MSEESEIINYYPVRAVPQQPVSKSVERRSHSGNSRKKELNTKFVRKARSKDSNPESEIAY